MSMKKNVPHTILKEQYQLISPLENTLDVHNILKMLFIQELKNVYVTKLDDVESDFWSFRFECYSRSYVGSMQPSFADNHRVYIEICGLDYLEALISAHNYLKAEQYQCI